jgi:hypothetical protein
MLFAPSEWRTRRKGDAYQRGKSAPVSTSHFSRGRRCSVRDLAERRAYGPVLRWLLEFRSHSAFRHQRWCCDSAGMAREWIG